MQTFRFAFVDLGKVVLHDVGLLVPMILTLYRDVQVLDADARNCALHGSCLRTGRLRLLAVGHGTRLSLRDAEGCLRLFFLSLQRSVLIQGRFMRRIAHHLYCVVHTAARGLKGFMDGPGCLGG